MWKALPSESMDAARMEASVTQAGTYPWPGAGDCLPAQEVRWLFSSDGFSVSHLAPRLASGGS